MVWAFEWSLPNTFPSPFISRPRGLSAFLAQERSRRGGDMSADIIRQQRLISDEAGRSMKPCSLFPDISRDLN